MSNYNIGSVTAAGNVFGDDNFVANGAGRLADLEHQFRRHRAQLDDPHGAENAIQSLKDELTQPQPQPKPRPETAGHRHDQRRKRFRGHRGSRRHPDRALVIPDTFRGRPARTIGGGWSAPTWSREAAPAGPDDGRAVTDASNAERITAAAGRAANRIPH